ncbi:hypothetical protein AAHA92_21665 [Salvia divinorum]|uniref:Uncharacterized protein n=1 Tax=Salvia divinorum TaxID=28513 RepID=A0ABD1GL61_SALDI
MIPEGIRLWPIQVDVKPVYPDFLRESNLEEVDEDTLAQVSSCGVVSSDFQSDFHDLDYLMTVSQLIGKDLHAELIIHGFLGPKFDSLQSTMPQSSEEMNERDISSDDKVTSFVDFSSSSNIKFDYVHQSEASDSDSDSDSDTDYQSNSENVEVDEDEDWVKLDEDFNGEDWEII